MAYLDKERRAAYLRKYQSAWMQKRRKEWFDANGPCVGCGATEDLMAHHKNPAQKVSHRVWSWSKPRMNEELAKCEVLCRSCHSKAHRPTPPHGSNSRYTSKDLTVRCRCDLCKEAHRKVAAKYRGKE